MRLPESLFNMSHELILPSKQSKGASVGIRSALNGYMFTLSFHIYNPEAIRVYFGFGGVVQRFKIKDAQNFWPTLFVRLPDNIKQRMKSDITKRDLKFIDPDFKKFKDKFFDPGFK
mmetsp:Transcript_8761/g.7877  ORF Transcript_8761/g.7877 Transcript_8761/m.7877 type:complete len:116 (+) Transcript_8761:297-644(+)